MKYNEELFNISREYTSRITPVLSTKEITELEDKVLNILLNRYKKILNVSDKKHEGILKIRLRGEDEGYFELKKLISLNRFIPFASEYCIYIKREQEKMGGDYIDLIWDYKTYFDILNSMNQKKLEYDEKNNIELMNSIYEFKKLPISHQLNVIKSFTRKVKKQKLLLEKEQIEDICKSQGHSFSKWEMEEIRTMQKNPYSGLRDYIVPEGMEWIPKICSRWKRKCKRCGILEIVEEEPSQVKQQREEQEKKDRIQELENELKLLKGK